MVLNPEFQKTNRHIFSELKREMDAPPPRLCHVTKWEDFDGYGFNLHAERNKLGIQSNQTKPNQAKPNQTKPNRTKPKQTKPNQT